MPKRQSSGEGNTGVLHRADTLGLKQEISKHILNVGQTSVHLVKKSMSKDYFFCTVTFSHDIELEVCDYKV